MGKVIMTEKQLQAMIKKGVVKHKEQTERKLPPTKQPVIWMTLEHCRQLIVYFHDWKVPPDLTQIKKIYQSYILGSQIGKPTKPK